MLEPDWELIAKITLAQLPKEQHIIFIEWIAHTKDMLDIYENCPKDALNAWKIHMEQMSRNEPPKASSVAEIGLIST